MRTLKLCVSLPDTDHPGLELRLSTDDAACDVVIALPAPGAPPAHHDEDPSSTASNDDYVLGGYAGI